jgi:flagellar biosynthetic protein FlhB
MSDKEQRTEQATPRRREKSREEGKLARSQDLTSVANFVGAAAALVFTGVASATLIARNTVNVLGRLDSSALGQLTDASLDVMIRVVVPVSLAAAAGSLLAGFGQAGWKPSVKPLTPELKKFNPLPKLQEMFFSKNSVIEVLKALAKIGIVGLIVGGIIYRQIIGSHAWVSATSAQLLGHIGQVAFDIGWRAAIAMVLLAILDYFWQRHRFDESIKMTRQEIRDEHKDLEGDPHVKGRRRQRMREMVGRRVDAVAEAAVVVVNPTHVAVALRYQPPLDTAPVVVAKGVDGGALRIRQKARRHQIPIHHDPPLARQLARRVARGRAVPPDLYRAIAAVLAAVLQARGGRA